MEFVKIQVLRGPNLWANFPVLEVIVNLGELKEASSELLPGFNERLMSWLPTLIEHRCSEGVRGGFFERLRRGTYPAHIMEHLTLELQSLAGTTVGYGRARTIDEEAGIYRVCIEFEDEDVAIDCLHVARELYLAAVYDRPFDVAGEIARLRKKVQEIRLGPSTRSICNAAKARGIPYRRLNENSLVQLGYGTAQRRIWAACSDRGGAIAEMIAKDKELTKKLLRSVGVPVPQGRPVVSGEDAWTAAQEFGLPVVVKPQCGNHGRGVATNLQTREQVLAAYDAAREEEETILLETFAPGDDYRILVVGERVIAASKRVPAHIIGDGVKTVAELIEVTNQDPRRGVDHGTSLSKITIDSVAIGVLAEQNLTEQSVPQAGQTVWIRRNGNLSTGGTACDVTDMVHPEVAARAVDAARVVGLDIAGVDIVCTDISRPLEEQGGAVVEVNAGPGLRMHVDPSEGQPRPVGEAIVDLLYPPAPAGAPLGNVTTSNGRIPIVGVTGVNGKTTVTRFIAHMLKERHACIGMTSTDGIYIGDRRIDSDDCAGPRSAKSVLLNPAVDAAVFETARGGIVREGLGFDRCDVAVVTNIGEGDHLGISGIDTLEMLAKVKRCIVDVVLPTGYAVLNAHDPHVAPMALFCKGSVCFFALDPELPVVVAHREMGGRAVFVKDGWIVLATGSDELRLMEITQVPYAHQGTIRFLVENTLAVVAAAWSLNYSAAELIRGLQSFGANQQMIPGRFNLMQIAGATVIVDYGHNVSALAAMIEAIEPIPHTRRTVVYSAAGDRRDVDMVEQGRMLGGAFDRVYLYEDHYLRGRPSGEIIKLFREGVDAAGRTRETFEFFGNLSAIREALKAIVPGEVLLVQADKIDETVNFMREYMDELATAAQFAQPVITRPTTPASVVV